MAFSMSTVQKYGLIFGGSIMAGYGGACYDNYPSSGIVSFLVFKKFFLKNLAAKCCFAYPGRTLE